MHTRAAAAAIAAALALPAHAQEAFNTYYGPYSQLLYGPLANPQVDRLAWRFTAAASGPVTALNISAYRTTAAAPLTLRLYEASGAQVGALLGSFPFTAPLGDAAPPITVFTPSSGITLTAGQDYFFALHAPTSNSVWWRIYGNPPVPGPQAYGVGAGPWTYFSHPDIVYPGFSITVPAPASAPLLTVPLITRRRRSPAGKIDLEFSTSRPEPGHDHRQPRRLRSPAHEL